MATMDDQPWPENHPAETLTTLAYRWNDDRGQWEVWIGGYWPWVRSAYGSDRTRGADLRKHNRIVSYADTWCEPSAEDVA